MGKVYTRFQTKTAQKPYPTMSVILMTSLFYKALRKRKKFDADHS